MEGTKFLFIDVEWNQIDNVLDLEKYEILQLAGMAVSQEWECERTFYRLVKPKKFERISQDTYDMQHTNRSFLEQAKPLEKVMENFFITFPQFEVLVIWSSDAYKVLLHNVKKLGKKLPAHKVVIVQELLFDIGRDHDYRIGFNSAITQAGVEYLDNLLHIAKHDVNYLYLLYKYVYNEYLRICREDDDTSCWRAPTTGVLHSSNCRYANGARGRNLECVSRDRVFYGDRVCLYCARKGEFNKLKWRTVLKAKQAENKKTKTQQQSITDKHIYSVCDRFNLKCQIGNGVVFVNTGIAAWRIYHDGIKVTDVMHENLRMSHNEQKKRKKANEGFHRQDVKSKTFYQVIQYIYYHDRNFFDEKRRNKMSRIDELFAMIESEKKGESL